MGICWSCFASKSNPVAVPAAPPSAPITVPASLPSPDQAPSSIGHLSDGDTSFLGSNVSGQSWLSAATTNITTWISQASGALGAIWANNNAEDNEFPPGMDDEAIPDGGTSTDSKSRVFTYGQLKAATFNFRHNMLLGRGGFGSVYKGWLKEKVPPQVTRKRAIGVKRLDANSKQGFRQWRTEVGFLRRLSHPNIVKLLGYCRENGELLIVYEFLQKGSLNYHLFGKGSGRLLPWKIRLKIAVGMAQGLSYLHMMETPIIYRDFKSSNILLDESYTAKISDFGLAKWGPTAGNTHVAGRVMGTTGYAAPEYICTGNLYVKSDVYGFGVVLVELLTGLRAIDKQRPTEQHNLVEWAKPRLKNRRQLKRIMDSRLEGKYDIKEALQVALLAVKCVHSKPQLRPSMKEVAETLEKIGTRYKTD